MVNISRFILIILYNQIDQGYSEFIKYLIVCNIFSIICVFLTASFYAELRV